jgi:uncharacterized protein (DUF697 family)
MATQRKTTKANPPADEADVTNTTEQLAEIAEAERSTQANNLVKNHVMVALTFGLVPVPLFDAALLIGNQVKMLHGLAKIYDVPFAEDRVKSTVIALLSGSLPVAGVIALSSGAKLIPGIGSLVGSGSLAITGGALTYAVGRVFIKHFESGGTLLNFDAKKVRGKFKKELDEGKKVAEEATEEVAANAKNAKASAGGAAA